MKINLSGMVVSTTSRLKHGQTISHVIEIKLNQPNINTPEMQNLEFEIGDERIRPGTLVEIAIETKE